MYDTIVTTAEFLIEAEYAHMIIRVLQAYRQVCVPEYCKTGLVGTSKLAVEKLHQVFHAVKIRAVGTNECEDGCITLLELKAKRENTAAYSPFSRNELAAVQYAKDSGYPFATNNLSLCAFARSEGVVCIDFIDIIRYLARYGVAGTPASFTRHDAAQALAAVGAVCPQYAKKCAFYAKRLESGISLNAAFYEQGSDAVSAVCDPVSEYDSVYDGKSLSEGWDQ